MAQLVARSVRDAEVARSSRVAPTISISFTTIRQAFQPWDFPWFFRGSSMNLPTTGFSWFLQCRHPKRKLALAHSSALFTINGRALPSDAYNVELYDIPKEEAEQAGFDFCNEFVISLDWVNESDTPLYAEGSTIEFTYEATIEDDAPSEVFGRGVYIYGSKSGHQEVSSTDFMTNTTYQATALLDGNIVIRRVDANSLPVAGAKYRINGVAATANGDGTYTFDKNGDISEFVTDDTGKVVILGVPLGEYTATEVSSPDGSSPAPSSLTIDLKTESKSILLGTRTVFSDPGILSQLGLSLSPSNIVEVAENEWIALFPGEAVLTYNYDSSTGNYTTTNDNAELDAIRKDGDNLYAIEEHSTVDYDRQFKRLPNNDYYLTVSESDIGYRWVYIIKSDDETITLMNGSKSAILGLGDDGCFHGDIATIFSSSSNDSLEEPVVCSNSEGGYELIMPTENRGEYYTFGYHFSPREADTEEAEELGISGNEQLFINDNEFMAYYASIVDDNQITLIYGFPIHYDSVLNRYFIGIAAPSPAEIEITQETIEDKVVAAEFLFRPSTGADSPESIPNPQTADLLPLAILSVTVLASVSYVATKRKTKR